MTGDGEGEKTILSWFTKKPSPHPFNPRLRYLFEHLDMNKIKAIQTRKDITGKEMNKLIREVRSIAFLVCSFSRSDLSSSNKHLLFNYVHSPVCTV
jgi:hypothetical protein